MKLSIVVAMLLLLISGYATTTEAGREQDI